MNLQRFEAIFLRFATMKAKASQLGFYISYFNTLLIISLKGWRWWYILVALIIAVLYIYESKYGIRGLNQVANSRSDHAIDTTKRLKRLEQDIQTLLDRSKS